MTKPDPSNQSNVTPAQRWVKRTITLLLLSALIVAGIAVYYTRQEWREMYMRVMHRLP
jgi:type II secretory pathway component PulF